MSNNTHYDNLKVARDADSDAIRAAYKELTQKYSSDQNPSADASRLMKVIHNSYSILSNPIQKSKYDQWLAEQESESAELKKAGNSGQTMQASGSRGNIHELKLVESGKSGPGASIHELKPVAGKTSAGRHDEKSGSSYRWLIYCGFGLGALVSAAWFGFLGAADESEIKQPAVIADTNMEPDMPNRAALTGKSKPSRNSKDIQNAVPKQGTGMPAHDQVAIGRFIGLWKGIDDASAVQQSLDISLKSDHSFVFRLDSKSGQSIGGLYGIAEFESGSARFFNKEYGCSIVFSIKADALNLATNDCQAFYRKGAAFDGAYKKPAPVKAEPKPVPKPAALVVAETPAEIAPPPQPVEIAPVVAKNTPKLRKYLATVQDSEGKVDTIELLAKDKDSARVIIRDFRGNPKVLKIKELKK